MTELDRVNQIRSSTREIVQHLGYVNNLFAHIGSISQCYTQLALEKKSLTLQEISSELVLESSTVSRLTKELVNKGYCTYSPNDQDGRSKYLELTKLGRQKVSEIHSLAIKQVQLALKGLTTEEKESILRGLSLYASALKKSSKGI